MDTIRGHYTGVHLTELIQIGLHLSGPLGSRADHHKRHRPSGRPLGARVRRTLRFLWLSRVRGPSELREDARALPTITTLRRTWQRHYERRERPGSATGDPPILGVRFKASRDWPRAAEGLESPYDTDARYRHKRDTLGTGYMVHVSETCEPMAPHLLTHAHTTTAAVHEAQCTAPIQQASVDKDLPPSDHLVDAAYIDAELLVSSQQEHGITLRGPPRPNPNWQAKVEGAYTLADFAVDWERRQVHCPQGKAAASWTEGVHATGRSYIQVRFRQQDCRACGMRAFCTQAAQAARSLTLQPQAHFEALHAAREGRRDAVPRRTRLWAAICQIPGSAENASATRRDGSGDPYRAARGLAQRAPTGEDPHLPLCSSGARITIRQQ